MSKMNIKQKQKMIYDTDLRFKALSNEIRRVILGLLYMNGPMYQSNILENIEIKSNRLVYHLNLLCKAGLIGKDYTRDGKNFSKYWIKETGKKYLDFIGASKELSTKRLNSQALSDICNLPDRLPYT